MWFGGGVSFSSFEANSDLILNTLIDQLGVGVAVFDLDYVPLVWNRFLEEHSGSEFHDLSGESILMSSVVDDADELKLYIDETVRTSNPVLLSWEQTGSLFKLTFLQRESNKPREMMQDVTFIPLRDLHGAVVAVACTVLNSTDNYLYQLMLQDALTQVEETARLDGMTGLFARHYWQSRVEEEFERASRYGNEFTVILVDLDHFKKINDTHGHLAGDEVLKEFSDRLQDQLRSVDVAGRYGGEEFGVMMPSTNLDGALVVAERIRKGLSGTPIPTHAGKIKVTCSVGVAVFMKNDKTVSDVINRADKALYDAKDQGRNQVSH